jgi:hypothetical protein
MKLLLRLLLLAMMGSAYAQSNLPACNGSGPNGSGTLYISNWTNCFGTGISKRDALDKTYVFTYHIIKE